MKTIHIPSFLMFLLIGNFSGFAQNWDYFKKDSLRVFYNPSQNVNQEQELLSGIDFRTYSEKNDSIFYDLSAFSRTISIDDKVVRWSREGYEYSIIGVYSGNSNFGSQVIVSEKTTTLIFKIHPVIDYDTVVLLNTNKVGTKWVAFLTNHFKIECEVSSVVKDKNDSIKSIRCKVFDRITFEDKTFRLKISKSFGLIESPVFFDILFDKSSLIDKKEVRLMTYREMAKSEFFAIIPETEMHIRVSNKNQWGAYKTIGSRRLKYLKSANDTLYYKLSEEFALINNKVTTSKITNKDSFVYINDSNSIFNPIPSKRISYSIPNETNNYFNKCGKLVVTQFNKAAFRAVHGDTIISVKHFIDSLHKEYTQNVGLTLYASQDLNNVHINEKLEYLFIPNECSIGKPSWRFTNVKGINHSLNIYPNPASSFIAISENIVFKKCTLVNSLGKVYNGQITNGQIDVSSIPNGFYIVELVDFDNIKYRNKLMIVH